MTAAAIEPDAAVLADRSESFVGRARASAVYVLVNLAVDLSYVFFDPRIRY